MMSLLDFLKVNKISQREFARFLGISNSTVCSVVNGKRPSKKIARLIEKKTGGKVRASTLLQQDPWIRTYRYY
jgi:predicted XRE-type DNA-binding protein